MKIRLLPVFAFMLLAGSLSAQNNKASVLLSSAIYEEEVSGNLDKAVELCLSIIKLYPDDRPVAAKALYHQGTDVGAAKNTVNYKTYGVLYNWPASVDGAPGSNSIPSGVKGACPPGWHLPSDAEWMVMERFLGMNEADLNKINPEQRLSGNLDKKLKSPSGWEDDNIYVGQSGFNAMPGGFLGFYKRFGFSGHAGYYWTSTPFDEKSSTRYIITGKPGFHRSPFFRRVWGLSVRCVKDS